MNESTASIVGIAVVLVLILGYAAYEAWVSWKRHRCIKQTKARLNEIMSVFKEEIRKARMGQ